MARWEQLVSKTPYDILYLGTNFEPFNILYFMTEGVSLYGNITTLFG
jgi:hypothetical protein